MAPPWPWLHDRQQRLLVHDRGRTNRTTDVRLPSPHAPLLQRCEEQIARPTCVYRALTHRCCSGAKNKSHDRRASTEPLRTAAAAVREAAVRKGSVDATGKSSAVSKAVEERKNECRTVEEVLCRTVEERVSNCVVQCCVEPWKNELRVLSSVVSNRGRTNFLLVVTVHDRERTSCLLVHHDLHNHHRPLPEPCSTP